MQAEERGAEEQELYELKREATACRAALEQEQTARFSLEEELAAMQGYKEDLDGRDLRADDELEAAKLEISVLNTRLLNFESQVRSGMESQSQVTECENDLIDPPSMQFKSSMF